jgi:eukaryotic-like serine/threonine-protein kinase
MLDINRAVDDLEGVTLEGDWAVTKMVKKRPWQSGGCFSAGYLVKHPDRGPAFLKVFDFSEHLRFAEPTKVLETMVKAFNFEKEILELCNGSNLDRVVKAISYGSVKSSAAMFQQLYYLIFELADCDARVQMKELSRIESFWCLRVLHQVAVGLKQLHGKGIRHQDIKPSNILLFDNRQNSKLGDLGRAHCKQIGSPFDDQKIPGALSYAPLEQLYSYVLDNDDKRRSAADLYLFGSMIFFMFSGSSLTAIVLSRLKEEHKPPHVGGGWKGFYHDVLPYIREAFEATVEEFVGRLQVEFASNGGKKVIEELTLLLRYACDPEPERRGHPRAKAMKHGNQFELERFVSSLAMLTKFAA